MSNPDTDITTQGPGSVNNTEEDNTQSTDTGSINNNITQAEILAASNTMSSRGTEQIAGCITLLRNFTGTDPTYRAEHFFQDIHNIGSLGNWSDQTKLVIVKSKFRERAAEFLSDNYELRATTSFEDFKKIVLDRFQAEEPLVTRMHAFMNTRQQAGQDVRQYATSLKSAAAKYYGTTVGLTPEMKKLQDDTTMCQFVAGLSDSIKRQVLSRSPQTLGESVTAAIQEEQNLTLMGKRTAVNAVEQQGTGERDSELLSHTLQEMLRRMEMTEKTVGQIRQEIRDRNVNERIGEQRVNYGNYRGYVPQEKFSRGTWDHREDRQKSGMDHRRERGWTRDVICFRCQRMGHIARNCGKPSTDERRDNTNPKRGSSSGGRVGSFRNGNFSKFSDPQNGPKHRNLNGN